MSGDREDVAQLLAQACSGPGVMKRRHADTVPLQASQPAKRKLAELGAAAVRTTVAQRRSVLGVGA